VRADQFDPALPQALAQRIAVVCFVGDHPQRFLPWTTRVMTPPYADRGQRRFREFDFRRGCRVKVLSQRLQTFLYVQASEFARLPGRSYRCEYLRRAAEAFTSGLIVLRCLRTHRICYPSEYRQLTEKGLPPF
jgi:hypothetical protein